MTDKSKRPATSGTRKGNGPGQGTGYGGPAKGFTPNAKGKTNFDATTNSQGHSVATPIGEGNRRALRMRQAEALMDVLHDVASDADRGPTQVRAIEAFQNRVWGMPLAKQEVKLTDNLGKLTDEQLEQIAQGKNV